MLGEGPPLGTWGTFSLAARSEAAGSDVGEIPRARAQAMGPSNTQEGVRVVICMGVRVWGGGMCLCTGQEDTHGEIDCEGHGCSCSSRHSITGAY